MMSEYRSFHIIAFMKRFPPASGGIQRVCKDLYQELVTNGNSVTIFLEKKETPSQSLYQENGIKIIPVRFPPFFSRFLSFRFIKYLIQMLPLVTKVYMESRGKRTLLHVNWIQHLFPGVFVSRYLHISLFWTCHNVIACRKFCQVLMDYPFWTKQARKNALNITAIITVSKTLHNFLLESNLCKNFNIITIHNGVGIKIFDGRNVLKKKNDIVSFIYAGRFEKHKKVECLIHAFSKVAKIGISFKLLIAGDGMLKNELEKLVTELALEDRILLLGHVNDIQKVFQICDYYVSASIIEGLPLAPIEAMACGCVPILRNIPQHREVVGEDGAGYLFDSEDDLINIIQILNREENLYRRKIAMERVGRLFSISHMANQYLDLFKQTISKFDNT